MAVEDARGIAKSCKHSCVGARNFTLDKFMNEVYNT